MVTPLSYGQLGRTADRYRVLSSDNQKLGWVAIVVLTVGLLAVYLDSLARVATVWDSPQYSHGFLIPLFALALLWLRREPFVEVPLWHRWVGLGLIAAGIALRIMSAWMVLFTIDNISLIPCIVGVFMLVGGLPTLKWAGPAVAFLIFMYPFPRVLEEKVMYPLQRLATMCSNVVLVTMGVDSVREGNVLYLSNRPEGLNVAEQCSGLRMLTIFTALAVAMALLMTHRPWWERLVIVLSAFPIAIAANVIRITLTGVLYNLNVSEQLANTVFHDAAGWIMMPIALGLLFVEIKILSHLFIDVPDDMRHVRIS